MTLEQYAELGRVYWFARRYLTEANNCYFTVSELTDDYNDCILTHEHASISPQQFKNLASQLVQMEHKECIGDKLGKYRLTQEAYEAAKEENLQPLKFTWEE